MFIIFKCAFLYGNICNTLGTCTYWCNTIIIITTLSIVFFFYKYFLIWKINIHFKYRCAGSHFSHYSHSLRILSFLFPLPIFSRRALYGPLFSFISHSFQGWLTAQSHIYSPSFPIIPHISIFPQTLTLSTPVVSQTSVSPHPAALRTVSVKGLDPQRKREAFPLAAECWALMWCFCS